MKTINPSTVCSEDLLAVVCVCGVVGGGVSSGRSGARRRWSSCPGAGLFSFLGDVGSAARRGPGATRPCEPLPALCASDAAVRGRRAATDTSASAAQGPERAVRVRPTDQSIDPPSPSWRSREHSRPRADPSGPPYAHEPSGPQPAASLPWSTSSDLSTGRRFPTMICFRSGDMIGMRRRDIRSIG